MRKTTKAQTVINGFKYCSKCLIEHPLNDFTKDRTKSSGYSSFCKVVSKEQKRQYYASNRELLLKSQVEYQRGKGYEKAKIRRKKYADSEKGKANNKRYRELVGWKNSYPKTTEDKLKASWRKKMCKVKNQTFFRFKTFDFLGYQVSDLKKRIEFNFMPGMTWENYGEWHIDHKKPLSYFDYTNLHQIKLSWMLCNLQPLWASDNLRKNDRYIG